MDDKNSPNNRPVSLDGKRVRKPTQKLLECYDRKMTRSMVMCATELNSSSSGKRGPPPPSLQSHPKKRAIHLHSQSAHPVPDDQGSKRGVKGFSDRDSVDKVKRSDFGSDLPLDLSQSTRSRKVNNERNRSPQSWRKRSLSATDSVSSSPSVSPVNLTNDGWMESKYLKSNDTKEQFKNEALPPRNSLDEGKIAMLLKTAPGTPQVPCCELSQEPTKKQCIENGLPPPTASQPFTQGKVKRNWTQRMLDENKNNESCTAQTGHKQDSPPSLSQPSGNQTQRSTAPGNVSEPSQPLRQSWSQNQSINPLLPLSPITTSLPLPAGDPVKTNTLYKALTSQISPPRQCRPNLHNLTLPHQDKKVFRPIEACGKKIVDHIVEKLIRSDFSQDKDKKDVETTQPFMGLFPSSLSMRAKSDNSPDKKKFGMGNRADTLPGRSTESNSGLWSGVPFRGHGKADWDKDKLFNSSSYTASSLVEKVAREVCDSGNAPLLVSTASPGSAQLHPADGGGQVTGLSGTAANGSPGDRWHNGLDVSTERTGDVGAKSLDIGEDQYHDIPLRKSRRANRGQKYQALIKEGIIQPSKERLAARSGARNVRALSCKEDGDHNPRPPLELSCKERITPPSTSHKGRTTPPFPEEVQHFHTCDMEKEKALHPMHKCKKRKKAGNKNNPNKLQAVDSCKEGTLIIPHDVTKTVTFRVKPCYYGSAYALVPPPKEQLKKLRGTSKRHARSNRIVNIVKDTSHPNDTKNLPSKAFMYSRTSSPTASAFYTEPWPSPEKDSTNAVSKNPREDLHSSSINYNNGGSDYNHHSQNPTRRETPLELLTRVALMCDKTPLPDLTKPVVNNRPVIAKNDVNTSASSSNSMPVVPKTNGFELSVSSQPAPSLIIPVETSNLGQPVFKTSAPTLSFDLIQNSPSSAGHKASSLKIPVAQSTKDISHKIETVPPRPNIPPVMLGQMTDQMKQKQALFQKSQKLVRLLTNNDSPNPLTTLASVACTLHENSGVDNKNCSTTVTTVVNARQNSPPKRRPVNKSNENVKGKHFVAATNNNVKGLPVAANLFSNMMTPGTSLASDGKRKLTIWDHLSSQCPLSVKSIKTNNLAPTIRSSTALSPVVQVSKNHRSPKDTDGSDTDSANEAGAASETDSADESQTSELSLKGSGINPILSSSLNNLAPPMHTSTPRGVPPSTNANKSQPPADLGLGFLSGKATHHSTHNATSHASCNDRINNCGVSAKESPLPSKFESVSSITLPSDLLSPDDLLVVSSSPAVLAQASFFSTSYKNNSNNHLTLSQSGQVTVKAKLPSYLYPHIADLSSSSSSIANLSKTAASAATFTMPIVSAKSIPTTTTSTYGNILLSTLQTPQSMIVSNQPLPPQPQPSTSSPQSHLFSSAHAFVGATTYPQLPSATQLSSLIATSNADTAPTTVATLNPPNPYRHSTVVKPTVNLEMPSSPSVAAIHL